MDDQSLWLFLVSAFGAEVIGTMAGFGAATILTPIASWFLPIKTAVAVVTCFHLFGNASRLYFFHRAIDWKLVTRFGITGVLLSLTGAHVAAWLPAHHIRLVFGSFLLLYVGVEVCTVTTVRVPSTTKTLLIGGAASGFIAGLIGTGGAIRAVCLLAFGLPKEAYLGTSAALALLVDATRLPVYLTQQFLPSAITPVILSLTVVAFGGAWCGQRLIRTVSPTRFKRFVLLVLSALAIKLLVDGARGIA